MRTIGAALVILGALSLVRTGILVNLDPVVPAFGPANVATVGHAGYRVPALEGIIILLGGITILRIGLRRVRLR